jgi:16S rRNA processing protein RimM
MQPPNPEDFRIIGRVVAAHGLQGTLKVESWSDFPERFASVRRLCLKRPDGQISSHEVKNVRSSSRYVFIKLVDLHRREEADEYRDSEVLIPDEESWPLPPDRYYVSELIGMMVLGTDGTDLGKVVDGNAGEAQDILTVDGPFGELLIPMVSEWVTEVDMTGRKIQIANWQALAYPEECRDAD